MSGGSFNYLFCKEAEDFLTEYDANEQLDHMIERLEDLNLTDIAEDSKNIRIKIAQIKEQLKLLNESIFLVNDVWQDVEYMDSMDCGLDTVLKTVEKYREKKIHKEKSI